MDQRKDPNDGRSMEPDGYDPPQVEKVLDAGELAREVNYAGAPISGGGAG